MDFAKCLAEMNLPEHIYEAASATYKALTESESDSRILKMATRLMDNFFTKDTIDEIVGKFEDMESLSVFGTDDDFKVTKELHDPIHVIVTAQLGGSQEGDQRKAETIYHNPPEITLFLSDRTGRLVHQYTDQHGKKYEADRDTLAKGWREVALHEASHALDCIVRGSDKFSRSSKSSLKETKSYEYANDLLETNARIPQIGNWVCEFAIKNKRFPTMKEAMSNFDRTIKHFSLMSNDTKKRTFKRIHDIWLNMKKVWDEHSDEIKEVGDFQKFAEGDRGVGIQQLLGKDAEVVCKNGNVMRFKQVDGDTYEIYKATYKNDEGSVALFNGHTTYNKDNPKRLIIDKLKTSKGNVIPDSFVTVKSIKQLS